MQKLRKLRLPVFKFDEDHLTSYRITYCVSSGICVEGEVVPGDRVDNMILSSVASDKIACIVEDEHQNKIKFKFERSKCNRGFVAYLREILEEHQYVIPKNMCVVECIRGGGDEIHIQLGLDINPAFGLPINF